MTGRDIEDIYQATIIDRARRPRHHAPLTVFDIELDETNPLCGDRVTLTLKCADGGRIDAIGYRARACAICLAATDLMVELATGMTPEAAQTAARSFEGMLRSGGSVAADAALAPLRAFEPLRDVPSRIGCAMLPWRALVRALEERPAANL